MPPNENNNDLSTAHDPIDSAPPSTSGAPESGAPEPSLRDTLNDAFDEHAGDEGGEVRIGETAEQRQERIRDERGRFAKGEQQPDPKAPKDPASQQQPPVDPKAPKAPPDALDGKGDPLAKAPRSWKPEAQAEWAKLSPQVRAEVARREADVQRVMQDSARDRQTLEQFGGILKPYVANIQAAGLQPAQMVQELFRADHELRHGTPRHRAQVIANVIKTYGVDIGVLDEVLSQPGAVTPPDPMADVRAQIAAQLRQEFAPVLQSFSAIQQQQQQAVQRSQAEAAAEVEAMADKPHFEELREDMADIMERATKRGVVMSLDQAYDRAIRLHPTLWESHQQQQPEAQRAARAEAARKARSVAAASVSGGSPAGHGAPPPASANTLRGDLEAAFDKHAGN